MSCTARIRPMRHVNETEIVCTVSGDHDEHSGELRDYAYPGSSTVVKWLEGDRRSFSGEWPGDCTASNGCILPTGHHGNCVA